ncbi:MAG: hypothetical protein ACODAA_00885 [Gemmatimonadota bacterium]
MPDQTARETLVATLGDDPYERIEAIRRAGERKARAEGVYTQMEHERKIVLAMVASEIEAEADGHIAENKLDRLAHASDRYRKHIRGLAAAAEERDLAISHYYALKSEDDWDRAAVAHENVLAKLGE